MLGAAVGASRGVLRLHVSRIRRRRRRQTGCTKHEQGEERQEQSEVGTMRHAVNKSAQRSRPIVPRKYLCREARALIHKGRLRGYQSAFVWDGKRLCAIFSARQTGSAPGFI